MLIQVGVGKRGNEGGGEKEWEGEIVGGGGRDNVLHLKLGGSTISLLAGCAEMGVFVAVESPHLVVDCPVYCSTSVAFPTESSEGNSSVTVFSSTL